MRKERTQQNVYTACKEQGSFLPLEKINQQQIRTMVEVALNDLAVAKELAKKTPQQSGGWNVIYKLHYDVLHGLLEAFLRFDSIKAKTHECLFAYICEKHPELELDWNFFERIRTKRNRSLYYGELITYRDWKEIEFQIDLYLKALKKTIETLLA